MKLNDAIREYLDSLPKKAGDPDSFVSEMPMEIPVVAKGDSSIKPEDYDSILEVDASYFPKNRVEGQAWKLTVKGKEYRIKRRSRRYGKGPVVAEMRAMVDGMKEAAQRGACRLIVKTDNRWCAHVLVLLWTPGKNRTKSVAKLAMDLMVNFDTVAVIHTRSRNIRRVDRAARRAAEERQTDLVRKESERLERLDEVIKRAASVHFKRVKGGWRANDCFHVTLYPPSCTCPQWSLRWKNVPLAGKRAQRLPCKHIIAVAMEEGIQHPEALIALSRKAKA